MLLACSKLLELLLKIIKTDADNILYTYVNKQLIIVTYVKYLFFLFECHVHSNSSVITQLSQTIRKIQRDKVILIQRVE